MSVKSIRSFFSNKENLKKFFIFFSAFIILLVLFCVYYFVISPQIHLKGDKTVVLNYKDVYKEKGYSASFLGKNITKDVVVKGKVNEKKLGEYKIVYYVKASVFHKKVIRIIQVKIKKSQRWRLVTMMFMCVLGLILFLKR